MQGLEIDILVPGHGAICEKEGIREEIERHEKFKQRDCRKARIVDNTQRGALVFWSRTGHCSVY